MEKFAFCFKSPLILIKSRGCKLLRHSYFLNPSPNKRVRIYWHPLLSPQRSALIWALFLGFPVYSGVCTYFGVCTYRNLLSSGWVVVTIFWALRTQRAPCTFLRRGFRGKGAVVDPPTSQSGPHEPFGMRSDRAGGARGSSQPSTSANGGAQAGWAPGLFRNL